MKINKQAVVKLNLWKQGLYQTPTAASKADALALVRRLGCIQLDTLNVLTRSHNLIFLSRMRDYTEEWYWNLYEEKEIIEANIHALAILPIEEYPYCALKLQAHYEKLMLSLEEERAEFLKQIHRKIKEHERQPIRSKDLNEEHKDVEFVQLQPARPNDWTTTPVRWSLDHLWLSGTLIQVRDRKFNKVYHLPEKWLPKELREQKMSQDETYRRFVRRSLDAMGVATISDVADYIRLKRETVQQVLQEFVDEGEVVTVEVEDDNETYYVQSSDLELLESKALAGQPEHNALLSPFDNLIWTRDRMTRLFGVDFRLESYVPQAQRKFGYFALPILIRGRIVGTIDLKTERKAKTLVVKKLVLFDTEERQVLISEIAPLLQNLMRFLKVDKLTVENEWDQDVVITVNLA